MGENLTERAMGLFVTRTLGDGVLDTRGYKLRCFAENLLCAAAAPASLAVATLFLGGGAGTILVLVLGAALALVVATSARTAREAGVGGVVAAAVIVLFLLASDWLFRHPILPG
ncbi:MAG TPA: hypothetical protein VE596_06805 [Gaiellaceae bacterium]|jgi:hypothetical protein|nr:hypothetical protein [Gaiellaceae bacterium]